MTSAMAASNSLKEVLAVAEAEAAAKQRECDHLCKALIDAGGELSARASSVDVVPCTAGVSVAQRGQEAFDALRWAVDFPLALVAVGGGNAAATASRAAALLRADGAASRRPSTVFVCGGAALPTDGAVFAGDAADAPAVGAFVAATMLAGTSFDKRALALPRNEKPLPASVDVVVVGGGLLDMVQAARLREAGHSVAVLEQRALVGGIWSMYANSTSQVNSSEGGYCLKEVLGRRGEANRDHSTAAEVVRDLHEVGERAGGWAGYHPSRQRASERMRCDQSWRAQLEAARDPTAHRNSSPPASASASSAGSR